MSFRDTNKREHGEYVTGRSGQVILFAARGPWNDETMKRGSIEMSEHIAALDHPRPWAQISCLYGDSIMPPSTFESFVKHTNIRKQIGLSKLAIAIIDSKISLTIQAQLSEAYARTDVEHSFYSTTEAAMEAISPIDYPHEQEVVRQFFAQNAFL